MSCASYNDSGITLPPIASEFELIVLEVKVGVPEFALKPTIIGFGILKPLELTELGQKVKFEAAVFVWVKFQNIKFLK